MELHKEIATWLAKFKLIQPNSKALEPNSELEDLVAIIRDGVVLCQVIFRHSKSLMIKQIPLLYIFLFIHIIFNSQCNAFDTKYICFSWCIH